MTLEIEFGAGQTWRIYYGPKHPMNRRIHIRAIVDNHVVYREWSKRQRCYRYSCELKCVMQWMHESGQLVKP